MELMPGSMQVYIGIGVVRIEKATATGFEVTDLDGDRFDVEADEVDEVLRPVVSAERAAVLTGLLSVAPPEFSDEPSGRRSRRYAELCDEGTIDEQIDALRAILHDPRNEPAERQNRKRYQDLLLGELAVAQSIPIGQLRRRLAAALDEAPRPIDVLPDRTAELPPQDSIPPCPGLAIVGAFHVERRVGAGEFGEERTFEAEPGLWFAYGRTVLQAPTTDQPGDDGDASDILLAVHAERVEPTERLHRWVAGEDAQAAGEEVPIDGARLMIADADAAADRQFIDQALSSGGPIVGGRVAQLLIGGDGAAQVSHATVDGRTVMVRVQA